MTPHVCLVGLQNLPVLAPEFSGLRAGGAELQQTLLAKALARKGFRVSMVVADLGQPDGARYHGVTTYRAYRPGEGLRFVRFIHPRWTKVWEAMHRANADVYYTSCAGIMAGEVAMFTRRHRKKLVFRIASNWECHPGESRLKFAHEKVLYRYGLARADLVLAQTAAQADALERNYRRASRVVAPLADVSAVRRAFRDRDIDVLWVGNVRKLKRAELLLEAARQLPELAFHMVGGAMPGSESYYEEIRERASALSNVTFHGLVPYRDMKRYYERARVHAATSETEGFPNTYLQAWAHGVPVVAFLDPESLVARNGLGRIVETPAALRDAIAHLARDEQDWAATSARCAGYIDDTFDEDRMLAPYVEAITGIADDGPSASGLRVLTERR